MCIVIYQNGPKYLSRKKLDVPTSAFAMEHQ